MRDRIRTVIGLCTYTLWDVIAVRKENLTDFQTAIHIDPVLVCLF